LAKQTEQAKLLREARQRLGLTNDQLAEILGVEPITITGWLLPEESKGHRTMSATARIALEYRLEQGPRKVAKILADLKTAKEGRK
jgi:transcriptional regulator with XRE-family HTH domain